jgi:hypothetical protein
LARARIAGEQVREGKRREGLIVCVEEEGCGALSLAGRARGGDTREIKYTGARTHNHFGGWGGKEADAF